MNIIGVLDIKLSMEVIPVHVSFLVVSEEAQNIHGVYSCITNIYRFLIGIEHCQAHGRLKSGPSQFLSS